MAYSDLLKDRRWQRKRLEVLDAAGWVCEECGSDKNSDQLHAHHLRYVYGRDPWDYPSDELKSLCKPCHDDATKWCKKLDELVREVKLGGSSDVKEAVGYLSALVANGWRAVAANQTKVAVSGSCDAEGIGNYVLGLTQADTFVMKSAGKSGVVDAHRLRSAFLNSGEAHKAIK
jgi:hypothetical protein